MIKQSGTESPNAPFDLSPAAQRWIVIGFVVAMLPVAVAAVGYYRVLGLAWLALLISAAIVLIPRFGFFLMLATVPFYNPMPLGVFQPTPTDLILPLLLVGAILEFFWRTETRVDVTLFDWPFLILIAASLTSVVFAHNRAFSITPMVRVLFIYVAFRISYRAALTIGVERVVKMYIWLVTSMSAYNVGLFLISGGQDRIFGPAWLTFETLSMTALPMAVAIVLFAHTWWGRMSYSLAATTIGLALLATQSRGPLLAVLIAIPILAWLVLRRGRSGQGRKSMLLKVGLSLVGLILLAVFLRDSLLAPAFDRFEAFIRSMGEAEGTVALRLVLWKGAVKAFLANPLTGIGIGNFRLVENVIPEMRFEPVWYYIGGMSVHNTVLQYFAETGLFGGLALQWLAVRSFRAGVRGFLASNGTVLAASWAPVMTGAIVFSTSVFFMRAWTWGQDSYIMALILALVAAADRQALDNQSLTHSDS